jgi:hypothetical protein
MKRLPKGLVVGYLSLALSAGSGALAAESSRPVGGRLQLAPPAGETVAAATPVTFGVVFRPGEVAKGKTIQARLAGTDLPVQLDGKRHYPDGSLKHGVVSLLAPKLEAAATLEFLPMEPTEAEPSLVEQAARTLLASDFEATVSFRFAEGGKPVSASARRMLEAGGVGAATWLNGPVAIEWLLSGAPAEEAGQADPDLLVQFQVRHYLHTGNTRVSAVVEKCSDAGSDGGLIYDVTFTKGLAKPEVVFRQENVHQPDLTRFRKVFWMGAAPGEVVIAHDARTMAAAGVIPQYDLSLTVPARTLEEQWQQWEDPRIKKGLFENGIIVAYFGTAGGRADIGPLPAWDTYYVLTMNPRQKEIMVATDELAAGVPIHGRERATGRVISYENRPKVWFADSRGGQYGTEKFRCNPAPPRAKEPVESIFSPETAHLPGFAYLSYVVTGDYFFLEENYFWAGYEVLSENPGYSKGTIYSMQLRGCAWGLRTVALAAGIALDGDPEKESFSKRVEYTLQNHLAALQGPEARAPGVLPIGNQNGDQWVYAPWQHDYMIMALDCAAGAGFKDAATLRSQLLEFSMGRFTHAPDFDPQYGCGYWWIFEDSKSNFKATTWKELFERVPKDKEGDLAHNDYPGSYCDLALAASAIGIRTGYAPARQVYEFLRSNAKNIIARRASYPCFAFGTEPIN